VTRISDVLAAGRCFSVELWPPRSTAAEERLEVALKDLWPLAPSFTSITYGAGGSTRERTHDLVIRLLRDSPAPPMAHLTCMAHTEADLRSILMRYRDEGVENVLALRGDPPLNATEGLPEGDLEYALDLVELAKSVGNFCVAVAAHPEGHPRSPDIGTDRMHLAEKLRVADFAITQFFFRVESYLDLVEALRKMGVDKPVLPGIMPITNVRTVSRMAELSGTQVPSKIAERIEAVADRPQEVHRIGVEIASEIGNRLLAEGAPGLHFYTMNSALATREVYSNLGLDRLRGTDDISTSRSAGGMSEGETCK
jgi:methylenetetrahydrofolate reductase (NADPH)